MTDPQDSKKLLLGLISTPQKKATIREKPSAPVSVDSDPERQSLARAPVEKNQFRDMMAKGESRDPIAGKRFRDSEKVTTGIYIRADIHKKLKILAAIERRKFNSYIEEAIDDYLEKIADRIPDIT